MHSLVILRKIKNLSQNPKSETQNLHIKICYIMFPNPESKIRNPKPKIQNLGGWGPHIKNCYITIQIPKSKIRPKKFGFWILDWGILDFGFWGGLGDVPLGNLARCLEVRGSNPPQSAFGGRFKTNCN